MTIVLAPVDAAGLASEIAARDFSQCRVTLVGYGNMGRQYVKAFRALGVGMMRICSRSAGPLTDLRDLAGAETVSGGFEALSAQAAHGDELAIIATPVDCLVPAAMRLAGLGFRSFLIEKPVALSTRHITDLAEDFAARGVSARVAYNRAAYPSLCEVRARAEREGGITSCTYQLTEMVKADWPARFPAAELARWGVANTLHVISMAHALIGRPAQRATYRAGVIDWHPAGAVFVGSGLSTRGIPFSYHGDWSAHGRWGVEVHTRLASYRLVPLETVQRRATATGDWTSVPVTTFAPDVKAGVAESVASILAADLAVRLPSLEDAAELTAYAEEVFNYHA